MGTTAAAGRKREAEENGRGREGDRRVCGERSWREEGNKEDGFWREGAERRGPGWRLSWLRVDGPMGRGESGLCGY
jgi:hypothetical protein